MNNSGISIRETSGGSDNFSVTGKWINKYTNKVINVINSVIDGDQMILLTDNNETISMSEFDNYVQCVDDDQPNVSAHVSPVSSTSSVSQPVGGSYQDYLMEDDDISAVVSSKPVQRSKTQKTTNREEPQASKQNVIIEKFFKKIPNINELLVIDFNTDVLPLDDLETIIEYMDLTVDDISNYIINHVMDKKYISEIVKHKLNVILGNTEEITSECVVNPTQENMEENEEP